MLAYRERVELQNVAGGPQDAGPRRAITTAIPARLVTPMVVVSPTRGKSRTASRVMGSTTKSRRRVSTKAGRATPHDLPARARDMPAARDVLPNIRLARSWMTASSAGYSA